MDRPQLSGTMRADMVKEYIAQKEYVYPPLPAMRLIVDTIEFCGREVPKWNAISISGYHIREAGSHGGAGARVHAGGRHGVRRGGVERGPEGGRASRRGCRFFFDAHLDFFEEIAKFRAARRIYARRIAEKYGAQDRASLQLHFHTQTAGCSLTAQQPLDDIALRTTWLALAGMLAGTTSLHTDGIDDAGPTTEAAVRLALRTQRLITFESGVADAIDPLAGRSFVEELTNRIEAQAYEYFERIEKLGGMVEAIKQNFPQREIADSAFRYQEEVERGERVVVGVNRYELARRGAA